MYTEGVVRHIGSGFHCPQVDRLQAGSNTMKFSFYNITHEYHTQRDYHQDDLFETNITNMIHKNTVYNDIHM